MGIHFIERNSSQLLLLLRLFLPALIHRQFDAGGQNRSWPDVTVRSA
jgi:hypothetical protein